MVSPGDQYKIAAVSVCPLCESVETYFFQADKSREYYRCRKCLLIHVPANQHLSLEQEKAVYDLHENHIHDLRYRAFLFRIFQPLQAQIKAGACGLDYGCGPGPALAHMFREQDYQMEIYDPIYARQPQVLTRQYDFITCTEVVEHFFEPAVEFNRLFALLKPGGWLGLMTKLATKQQAFNLWHYKNDLTHVCFYSRETFRWLAAKHQSTLAFYGQDAILMKNTSG